MQKRTLEILKNFAQISTKALINVGSDLRTRDINSNIFAFATVPDQFPVKFAIYDLNEFIATYMMFDEPSITYREDFLTIEQGRSKVKYVTTSESAIPAIPSGKIKIGDVKVTFHMTKEQIAQAQKAASVLALSDLRITKNTVTAENKSQTKGESNGSNFECEYTLQTNEAGDDDEWTISIADLKIIPDGYTFEVGEKALQITSDTGDVFYVLAYKQI